LSRYDPEKKERLQELNHNKRSHGILNGNRYEEYCKDNNEEYCKHGKGESGNLQFTNYIEEKFDDMAIESSLVTLIEYKGLVTLIECKDLSRRCRFDMAADFLATKIQEPDHDNNKMTTKTFYTKPLQRSLHNLILNTNKGDPLANGL
jgi:hypothetical protein